MNEERDRRPHYYTLDGHTAVPAYSMEQMDAFEMEIDKRRVAKTEIGDIEVSTVFLMLDHAWEGKPQLFETMLFGGNTNNECWRYATWDEAAEGHRQIVEAVKRGEYMQAFEPKTGQQDQHHD